MYARIEVKLDKRVELSGQVSPIELKMYPVGSVRFPDSKSPVTQKIKFKSSTPNFEVRDDDPDEPKPITIDFNVTFYLKACTANSKVDCPMLRKGLYTENLLQKRIDLKTGCANKHRCKCNLQFSHVPVENSVLQIGPKNHLDLEFRVTNVGDEPAYGVVIVIASNVDFSSVMGPRGDCKPRSVVNNPVLGWLNFGQLLNFKKPIHPRFHL